MTVLIITHSEDNESIPLVLKAIEKQGGKGFRFDTDRFPTEIQLDVYYSNGTQRMFLTSETQKRNPFAWIAIAFLWNFSFPPILAVKECVTN